MLIPLLLIMYRSSMIFSKCVYKHAWMSNMMCTMHWQSHWSLWSCKETCFSSEREMGSESVWPRVKGLQHISGADVELLQLTCAFSNVYEYMMSGLQQLQRHRVETSRSVSAQLLFSIQLWYACRERWEWRKSLSFSSTSLENCLHCKPECKSSHHEQYSCLLEW